MTGSTSMQSAPGPKTPRIPTDPRSIIYIVIIMSSSAFSCVFNACVQTKLPQGKYQTRKNYYFLAKVAYLHIQQLQNNVSIHLDEFNRYEQ